MNLLDKIIKNKCICSFCRHFCVKIQKILAQSLLLTLPKQFSAECIKQIKIQKNVSMPAKITMIYRLQGHIHMQILKKTQKKFFSTCHIIKIPLNCIYQ